MRVGTFHIESMTPYCASRFHGTPKLDDKEQPDAYDERTWREKAYFNDAGFAYLQARSFKFSLISAAERLSMRIPGRRQATYTKHFRSGLVLPDDIVTGETRETIKCVAVFVNADGKRGGGTRVLRRFPIIHHWAGRLVVHILDEIITPDVLEAHMREAAVFVGVGQNRPERTGENGRWHIRGVDWIDDAAPVPRRAPLPAMAAAG